MTTEKTESMSLRWLSLSLASMTSHHCHTICRILSSMPKVLNILVVVMMIFSEKCLLKVTGISHAMTLNVSVNEKSILNKPYECGWYATDKQRQIQTVMYSTTHVSFFVTLSYVNAAHMNIVCLSPFVCRSFATHCIDEETTCDILF